MSVGYKEKEAFGSESELNEQTASFQDSDRVSFQRKISDDRGRSQKTRFTLELEEPPQMPQKTQKPRINIKEMENGEELNRKKSYDNHYNQQTSSKTSVDRVEDSRASGAKRRSSRLGGEVFARRISAASSVQPRISVQYDDESRKSKRESMFRKYTREFEDEEEIILKRSGAEPPALSRYSVSMRGSQLQDLRGKSGGVEQMQFDSIRQSLMFGPLGAFGKKSDHFSSIGVAGLIEEMEKKLKYILSEGPDRPSIVPQESDRKLRFGEQQVEDKESSSIMRGMRFEYGKTPKMCERYMKLENFSKLFVDEIMEDALVKERDLRELSAIKIVEGIEYREDDDSDSAQSSVTGSYVCVFNWPTIDQFTVEVGTNKLEEYLSYWRFEEDWKYCIDFLQGDSDSACDFYRYEAIFSIPCKQYPVPQATASVYFTFELSRVRPRDCLVEVYYCFEGQRLMHEPGNFTFQEERLFHIIDAKINFYKSLTF